MKVSQFKDYSELPLFLNAELVVVPKEKFIQWVEQNTVGGTQL